LLADERAPQTEDRALEEDVLPPGQIGMEAGAEFEQGADATADRDGARSGLDDPGDQPQERRLAGAVPAHEADRASRLRAEGHVAKRPDVGAAHAPPGHDEILQRPGLAGIDAEAPRSVLHRDLATIHAAEGIASVRRTIAASTRTNAASRLGTSIRRRLRPSSAALSCASTSMSQRISR